MGGRFCLWSGLTTFAVFATSLSAGVFEPRLGNCHMEACSWYRELQRDLLGTSNRGALYEVNLLGGTSHHPDGRYDRRRPIKWNARPNRTYVFCSKTLPIVMTTYDSTFQKDFLEIGRGVIGAYLSSLSLYGNVCHNTAITDEANFAETFGYKPSIEQFEALDSKIKQPTDILDLP